MSATKLNVQVTLTYTPDGYTYPTNDANGHAFPVYSLDGYAAGSTSFYSIPISVGNVNTYSISFSCPSTGSPSGTVGLQACNDKSRQGNGIPDNTDLLNWIPLYFTPTGGGSAVTTQTVTNATQVLFEEVACSYQWVRVVYTASSGSITVTAKASLKGF